MPNGKAHRRAGRVVGTTYATIRAYMAPSGDPLIEGLAGYFGGPAGAWLPDILEPACWHHRRTAHSVTCGAVLIGFSNTVETWAESCRRRAAVYQLKSLDPCYSGAEQLWFSLVALFWQALAGFLNGALAGYVSHLAMDARTKASIPIL